MNSTRHRTPRAIAAPLVTAALLAAAALAGCGSGSGTLPLVAPPNPVSSGGAAYVGRSYTARIAPIIDGDARPGGLTVTTGADGAASGTFTPDTTSAAAAPPNRQTATGFPLTGSYDPATGAIRLSGAITLGGRTFPISFGGFLPTPPLTDGGSLTATVNGVSTGTVAFGPLFSAPTPTPTPTGTASPSPTPTPTAPPGGSGGAFARTAENGTFEIALTDRAGDNFPDTTFPQSTFYGFGTAKGAGLLRSRLGINDSDNLIVSLARTDPAAAKTDNLIVTVTVQDAPDAITAGKTYAIVAEDPENGQAMVRVSRSLDQTFGVPEQESSRWWATSGSVRVEAVGPDDVRVRVIDAAVRVTPPDGTFSRNIAAGSFTLNGGFQAGKLNITRFPAR